MKHEDRRRELGKMLMDVAKYLATVGFIGNLLAGEKYRGFSSYLYGYRFTCGYSILHYSI